MLAGKISHYPGGWYLRDGRQQFASIAGGGLAQHALCGADFHQLACPHHPDVRGQLRNHRQAVRNEIN
jgi:hypothetical protein